MIVSSSRTDRPMFRLTHLYPPLRRWVFSLRPHDPAYHRVRRIMEFMWTNRLSYDAEWDKYISTCVDLGMVRSTGIGGCTVEVGEYEVWITNFPYHAGEGFRSPNGMPIHLYHRPSIMTLYRLRHAALAVWREEKNRNNIKRMENTHV